MNLLYFFQKELCNAWHEANRPLFPECSESEHFSELFNYYHSLKGKTIDTSNGESLFPVMMDNAHPVNREPLQITKAQRKTSSEVSVPVGFPARSWKAV